MLVSKVFRLSQKHKVWAAPKVAPSRTMRQPPLRSTRRRSIRMNIAAAASARIARS